MQRLPPVVPRQECDSLGISGVPAMRLWDGAQRCLRADADAQGGVACALSLTTLFAALILELNFLPYPTRFLLVIQLASRIAKGG